MKVILLQEIKGQGGEGDVIDVKRGYAVNYLFPQKMAIEASKGNLKQLELRKHNIAKREAERLDSADKIQAALADRVLVIEARVGEEGQLFGSVTTQQIADKLGEELGLEIDRKKIDLNAPIKTAGEHVVSVTIYRDIKATVTISVVSDVEAAKERNAANAAKDSEVVEAALEAAEIAEEAAEIADAAAVVVDEAAEVAEEAAEVAEEAAEIADEVATEADLIALDAEIDEEIAEEARETEEEAEELLEEVAEITDEDDN